jgi:hypothetical protein
MVGLTEIETYNIVKQDTGPIEEERENARANIQQVLQNKCNGRHCNY